MVTLGSGSNVPRWFGRPLTHITPFTIRDGVTFERKLDWIYNYITEQLAPELDGVLDAWFTQYKLDHEALLADIADTKAQWQAAFDQFMSDIVAQLEALNDQAVANLIGDVSSLTFRTLESYVERAVLDDGVISNTLRPQALSKVKAVLSGAGEKTVYAAFLGSSTTEGAFSSDGMSYPEQLVERMGKSLPLKADPVLYLMSMASSLAEWNFPGLYMANGATSGKTSANYFDGKTAQITNILSNADCVFFHMIGSNDQNLGVTPAAYETNVRGVISSINNIAAGEVVHVLIHSFARTDKTTFAYEWSEYGEALKRISDDDIDNVMFIDLSKDYERVGVPGNDDLALMSADRVHQNERGHVFTANLLADYLELKPAAPYFPTSAPVFDGFTDSNGTNLTTHIADSGGSPWGIVTGGSAWSIQGNAASATGTSIAIVDVGSSDVEVSARVIYGSPGTRGVCVRVNPESGSRFTAYVAGTRIVLNRVSAQGGTTDLAERDFDFTNGVDFVIRVVAVGRMISVYIDSELIIAHRLPENLYGLHIGSTHCGLRSTMSGDLYRSFSAKAVA